MVDSLVIQSKLKRYQDLDDAFELHPVRKDVLKVVDSEAIKQSVKNLVFLNRFEKPFHPEIESGVYGLLFEPISPFTSASISSVISRLIQAYETRVDQVSVTATPYSSQDGYVIDIAYRIIGEPEISTVSFPLYRVR